MKKDITRRTFFKIAGAGALASGAVIAGCTPKKKEASSDPEAATTAGNVPDSGMTYRVNPHSGDSVSLLGYGMMRLPMKDDPSGEQVIDQEQVNALVDYAMAHGVNYYDTSPAYCRGKSENATGIALSRHPRDKYFIATKLSNFAPQTWPREKSIEMYRNSMKELQTDYIDYLLLHSIGGYSDDMDWLQTLNARYFDNGILDFLAEEKKAGRIRNLGFSYHGDIRAFDYLLKLHDEGKYKWDFVQIQHNYLDWQHSRDMNPRNTNSEYLYAELEKRGIPAVIMEPLLGGRLANVPDFVAREFKQRDPKASVASWAFRYAGTAPGILTVLSGMTYMEHLQDNLRTYMPLREITAEENDFMMHIAGVMANHPAIPCTDCKYCMPCPYGLDIPANFAHYNKCLNEGEIVAGVEDSEYGKRRRAFLVGYDRAVPRLRQAAHCTACGHCLPECPQHINIPREMQKIDAYAELLRRNG